MAGIYGADPDGAVGTTDRSSANRSFPDRFDHPRAISVPLAVHVEQMADARRARIGDLRDRSARLYEPLREPVVTSVRSNEIPGTNDQDLASRRGWGLFRPDPPLGNQTAAALVAQMYPQPVEDDVQAVAQANQKINVRKAPEPPSQCPAQLNAAEIDDC
jgi:hypothetical protein